MSSRDRYEIVDPDVDLHDPAQRDEIAPHRWDVLLACAVGGVLGSWARYGVATAIPTKGGDFPWSTVLVNASGCLLIGVLMTVLLQRPGSHRIVRPFLGVGVLGGYTTYSTFAVDVERMVLDHHPAVAAAYLVSTVVGCGAAVWIATSLTARVVRPHGALV